MKALPSPDDPWALQARIMDAVIDDLWDGGNRFQVMREIRRQELGDASAEARAFAVPVEPCCTVSPASRLQSLSQGEDHV